MILVIYSQNREYVPSNVAIVLEGLSSTVELNAIPKAKIIKFIVNEDYDLRTDSLAYQLGIFGVALTGSVILIVTLELIRCFFRLFPSLKSFIAKLINKAKYNLVIKTFQAGFLNYCLSSVTNIHNGTELVVSYILLTSLVGLVIINFTYLLLNPLKHLEKLNTKSKVGAAYSDLNIFSKVALFKSTLFYIIRGVICMLLVSDWPFAFKIQGMVFIVDVDVWFQVRYKPFQIKYNWRRNQSRLELFNTVSLSVVITFLLAFTGLLPKVTEFEFGWSFIGLVMFVILVNVGNLLHKLLKIFKQHLYFYK